MATSLAQQLKRLAAPQTSVLKDSSIRVSLLFDPKEAANKDFDTIYEIGISGLEELIVLNPIFSTFEANLFARTSKEFQRAVETQEVNEKLNKTIKKFLLHLSPYFPLQPAHKCLEWLIRRFSIHSYNKDELMMLALPYHETNIFIRCVQILNIRGEKDNWFWLKQIRKSGIPLPKLTLFNHAGSDQFFLKFIGNTVLDAVRTLGDRSPSLQVMFAFYCTTTIGTLFHLNTITEHHVTNILPALLKGLSSGILDFAAASYMITAQLITKTNLNKKILAVLFTKLSSCQHNNLISESIMLMNLILFHNQDEFKSIPEKSFNHILENVRFATVLGQVQKQNINLSELYIAIMTICLKRIQLKQENWVACKKLLENMSVEVLLNDEQAKAIIQCALGCYGIHNESENSVSVISIDSDDEQMDVDSVSVAGGASCLFLDENNADVLKWYSDYLKRFERLYPEAFDNVIKIVMKGSSEIISQDQKRALKAVLAFLLKATYMDDNTNLIENLYHHNPIQRMHAIEYLSQNFNSLSLTAESQDLIRNSLSERLNDDNPQVIEKILKINSKNLIEIIGEDTLLDKILNILNRSLTKNLNKWKNIIILSINLLTSPILLEKKNYDKIFFIIFPLLFPNEKNSNELEIFEIILKSKLKVISKFLQLINNRKTKSIIENNYNILNSKNPELINNLPKIEFIFENLLKIDINKNGLSIFYGIILISYGKSKVLDSELYEKIFDYLLKIFESNHFSIRNESLIEINQNIKCGNYLTYDLIDLYLKSIIIKFKNEIQSNDIIEFNLNSINLMLIKNFNFIINNLYLDDSYHQNLFENLLKFYLNELFQNFDDKMKFLINYIGGHIYTHGNDENNLIDCETQLKSIILIKSILKNCKEELQFDQKSNILFLFGLNSKYQQIRHATVKCMQIVSDKFISNPLFKQILLQKDEIIFDCEQIPLILFKIFTKAVNKSYLKEMIDILLKPDTPDYFVANLMEILKHVNNLDIFKKLSIIGVNILKNGNKNQLSQFSVHQSLILKSLLMRFDEVTTKSIQTCKDSMEFLTLVIQCNEINMRNDTNLVKPPKIIFDILNNEMFLTLNEQYKTKLILLIIKTSTFSLCNDIMLSGMKLFKSLDINAKSIETILVNMKNIKINSPVIEQSTEILLTEEWKIGVTLLEFLQNKSNISKPEILFPNFFDLLKKCLDFEEQSPVEYVKQMLLSCVLNFCQNIQSKNFVCDNKFRIDYIVQCIRATQNPQTHHHALLLLCYTASMLPEQVLSNIMDIFTFMGSTVIRHDDGYSFQIIAKILDTIIPILVKSNTELSDKERDALVIPILRIFTDIILDVPQHRRVPLYKKLIQKLDPKKYLWKFVSVLFESHVNRHDKEKITPQPTYSRKLEDDFPKRIKIALEIAKEFGVDILLENCTELIQFLRQYPAEKPDDKPDKSIIDSEGSIIFPLATHTSKQLRHYKYINLQFINLITSSPEFVNGNACLDEDAIKSLKPFYQQLIIKILMYIPEVSRATELYSNTPQAKYWKIMLHLCYDILDNIISLLSPDTFLLVVDGLLKHKILAIRKRIIELLINKLQHKSDFIEKCDKAKLLQLLDPLSQIVAEIDGLSNTQNESIEIQTIQQISLIAIKLLSKVLCLDYPHNFKEILNCLTEKCKYHDNISNILLATLTLCLGEVCVNLRAHSLSNLSKFMPIIIDLLKSQIKIKSNLNHSNPLVISLITTLQKIIEAIPLFLSPYIIKIIITLSELAAEVSNDEKLNLKLQQIFVKISTTIPGRILIPSIDKSYQTIIKKKKFDSIKAIMFILSNSYDHLKSDELNLLHNELASFYLISLNLRCDLDENDDKLDRINIDDIENSIIKSFVSLILKLSETTFRPLYYKIFNWAIADSNDSTSKRAITFYNVSHQIAESLKSIFTLFADSFLQNASELLDKCNSNKIETNYYYTTNENNIKLIQNIIKTLNLIFVHDAQNFINLSRFNILMQPIVDQLENELILEHDNIKDLIAISLGQLAVCINDDSLWKQLNYQILLKTRTNNPSIRMFALKTCLEIARKLGENFLPFLPETIPFLAELLEDENKKVEKFCQKSVQELEKIVGEPLQKYF